jgi:hypothetical protein
MNLGFRRQNSIKIARSRGIVRANANHFVLALQRSPMHCNQEID